MPFVHEPPDAPNFPRPMPNKIAPPEWGDFWHSLGEWLQPKLGLAVPAERWI